MASGSAARRPARCGSQRSRSAGRCCRSLAAARPGRVEIAGAGLGQAVKIVDRGRATSAASTARAAAAAPRRRSISCAVSAPAATSRRAACETSTARRRGSSPPRRPRANRLAGEFRHQHQPRALHQGEQADPEAEDEGQLQRQQHDVVAAEAEQPVEHGKLVGQPLVADHRAFRRSGRAGGEHDQRRAAQQRPLRRRCATQHLDAGRRRPETRAGRHFSRS